MYQKLRTPQKMKHLVQTYENVISESLSKQLIAMFERYPQHHEDVVLDGHRSFKQVTMQLHEQWKPFEEKLQEVFYSYIDKYMKDSDVTERMFPPKFAFENFRLKRYMLYLRWSHSLHLFILFVMFVHRSRFLQTPSVLIDRL